MELYTAEDIRNILRLKKKDKVYHLCACKLFPCFKLGKEWLIDKAEFHKWLDIQLKGNSKSGLSSVLKEPLKEPL